jgi:hypothetical protein
MQAQSGAGEAMYGFVGCTVRWFMTGTVVPVNRQTTMRVLAGVIQKQGAKGAPFRGKQRPSSGASWDRGSFEMA